MLALQNNRKVFLVDDDVYHLNVMSRILKNLGVTDIVEFDNGIDCLNSLHLKPSIVFLDHHMDVYNGRDVLQKIKRYDPNIYVIMVSGQEEMQVAIDSLKHGAFDYLKKLPNIENQIEAILQKIDEVEEELQHKQPSLLSKLFK